LARGEKAGSRGPLWAGLIALLAGLPSLGLPFLSDDWSHAIAARDGSILVTPFAYFRPLTSIDYWIDWQVWGWNPVGYRIHGVILAAIAASLVVVLVRRYTGDTSLATTTGIVFALHPYHVGAVAWIAARSDLLSAVLVLAAAWSFDRWSDRSRALPWSTLLLYELALLAKEGAVVLPAFLVVVALCDRNRRLSGTAWLRAFAPFVLIAMAHFLILRPAALGSAGLGPLKWLVAGPVNLMLYGASSVLPLPPEVFQSRLWVFGGVAALVTIALLAVARRNGGRVPPVVWPAAAAFVVLLGPSLIGFVQRYYFLPGAASALALAALLRACPRIASATIGAGLAVVWIGTATVSWVAWYDGGTASRAYVGRLVEISRDPGIETIVVVGAPHRVHGVPVTAAFDRVVALLGGRDVDIVTAGEFDYPSAHADALAGVSVSALGHSDRRIELQVEPGPYSRYVWAGREMALEGRDGLSVVERGPHRIEVGSERRAGRVRFVWSGGELKPF